MLVHINIYFNRPHYLANDFCQIGWLADYCFTFNANRFELCCWYPLKVVYFVPLCFLLFHCISRIFYNKKGKKIKMNSITWQITTQKRQNVCIGIIKSSPHFNKKTCCMYSFLSKPWPRFSLHSLSHTYFSAQAK